MSFTYQYPTTIFSPLVISDNHSSYLCYAGSVVHATVRAWPGSHCACRSNSVQGKCGLRRQSCSKDGAEYLRRSGDGSAPFGFVLRRDIPPDIKSSHSTNRRPPLQLLPSGALAGRRGVGDDLPSNEKHEPHAVNGLSTVASTLYLACKAGQRRSVAVWKLHRYAFFGSNAGDSFSNWGGGSCPACAE